MLVDRTWPTIAPSVVRLSAESAGSDRIEGRSRISAKSEPSPLLKTLLEVASSMASYVLEPVRPREGGFAGHEGSTS